MADIVNSYDNTAELAQTFPTKYPTPVAPGIETRIQNRLLTGFENWNRGYEAWEAWGDILYTPESLYNVHGVHLTLKEYQAAMKVTLQKSNMQMGDFRHIVTSEDWVAIQYEIADENRETGEVIPGSVMEFVHFGDLKNGLGTRVIEGWAGSVDPKSPLAYFQTEEERAAQKAALDEILATEIPEIENLELKYPVKYPTSIPAGKGEAMKERILADFDAWNQGAAAWSEWAGTYYAADLAYNIGGKTLGLKELLAKTGEDEKTSKVTRLYFEQMLVRGDWAAIHYRTATQDVETGERIATSCMQFLHFVEKDGALLVDESWTS